MQNQKSKPSGFLSSLFTLSLHRAACHFTQRHREKCSYSYIAFTEVKTDGSTESSDVEK